ncbi:hypothetical protein JG688_00011363 [Phytophthora aleatoria]|uniref:Uncharacterized protein n=1 Tax=Phytophthora aleatoria TaxID=2496075 RepID=A0A8J5ICT1_9STRA|nr:hypothetical protein JG688_00011363 [Phytophthora aleatoria]
MADGVVVLLLVQLTLTAAELLLVVLMLDRAKSLRLALATPAAACRRLLRSSVVFLAWLQSASVLGRLVWLGLLPCE